MNRFMSRICYVLIAHIMYLFYFYSFSYNRLINWGQDLWQSLWQTRDITAIFTANFTAIICYIAWVQSPFMMEAKNDLCLAKRQSQAREHPFSREQAKNIYFAI